MQRAMLQLTFALMVASPCLDGCGARTQLRGAQPCYIEGETLPCVGVCGEGTVTCTNGFYGACEVPFVEEVCEDSCGEGTRSCQDELWTECDVPRVEETCEDECGSGLKVCENDSWGSCEVPPITEECFSKCGSGERSCADSTWTSCTAPPPLPPKLRAIVRDFSDSHPDFETGISAVDPGIVEFALGPDDRPVYANPSSGTASTTSAFYFDQWYRDVPGVNERTEIELPLTTAPSDDRLYIYRGADFFPIDGMLLGNEGRPHNYHFTLEATGTFIYRGGETFSFLGDDDVFVFINRRLVIDLGGLHESLSAEASLDDLADTLQISLGEEYALHIFFAERQTVASNFNIQTSIEGLGECPE